MECTAGSPDKGSLPTVDGLRVRKKCIVDSEQLCPPRERKRARVPSKNLNLIVKARDTDAGRLVFHAVDSKHKCGGAGDLRQSRTCF